MDWTKLRNVSLVAFSLFILAGPPISNYSRTSAIQLVFFGTSQAIVLNGQNVLLTLNLTNVEPTPVDASAQAVIENALNNETFAVENSSVFALAPSIPTIVNMTISGLTLCTNYSVSILVYSASGAPLTPARQLYTFPCEAYAKAFTLASPLEVASSFPPTVNATFTNSLAITLNAVVFGIYRNSAGETVCVCTSSINLAPGETESVLLIAAGIPTGAYNATVFVWDTNGTPISPEYTVQVGS